MMIRSKPLSFAHQLKQSLRLALTARGIHLRYVGVNLIEVVLRLMKSLYKVAHVIGVVIVEFEKECAALVDEVHSIAVNAYMLGP